MTVRQALKALGSYRIHAGDCAVSVSGVSVDSHDHLAGRIFVAVRGSRHDGHDFIAGAGSQAAGVVFQSGCLDSGQLAALLRRFPRTVIIEVPDSRKAAARLAAKLNGYPSKRLHVCGITGTNGKTTLTYLIESLVSACGHVPGVIGTVNYRFGSTLLPSANTTPGAVQLQQILRRMVDAGVEYLAMEVSSHALDQGRVEGIRFGSAIFTNLTQDHLDYHRCMPAYFRAKARLFRMLDAKAAAVLNMDDPYGRQLLGLTPARVITYALEQRADVSARIRNMTVNASECTVRAFGRTYPLRLRLIGRHNLYNALAVFAWGLSQGFSARQVCASLEAFSQVPGRLERVAAGSRRSCSVFVDYAHTEDALRNVLSTLRQVSTGRIITVFGCGGERDAGKRPLMGVAATSLSDHAIITSDNPRGEDPAQIIRQIAAGIHGTSFTVIPDRRKAICRAIAMAGAKDIVLIAGKGHEQYQIIGSRTIHFDDREEAARCLRSRK